jgi:hypothetical protein
MGYDPRIAKGVYLKPNRAATAAEVVMRPAWWGAWLELLTLRADLEMPLFRAGDRLTKDALARTVGKRRTDGTIQALAQDD